MKSYLPYLAIIISVIAVVFAFQQVPSLGGYTAGYWDSADGYKVDGTTVIDGSGNVDAAITSGSNSTFAGTLTVSGETNLDTLVYGGDDTSLTATDTDFALTAAQVCNSSILEITPATTVNMTLPTASALAGDCLTADGDVTELVLRNLGSADNTVTVVASTGDIMVEPDGQNVVIGGGNIALFKLIRASSTGAVILVDEAIDAD